EDRIAIDRQRQGQCELAVPSTASASPVEGHCRFSAGGENGRPLEGTISVADFPSNGGMNPRHIPSLPLNGIGEDVHMDALAARDLGRGLERNRSRSDHVMLVAAEDRVIGM